MRYEKPEGFLGSLGTFLEVEYPYAPIDTLTIEIHPLFATAQTNILREIYYIFVKNIPYRNGYSAFICEPIFYFF